MAVFDQSGNSNMFIIYTFSNVFINVVANTHLLFF